MIDGLKPYLEYKASGLPWLDHIPIGWKILRGKSVFHVLDVRSESGKEEILTVSASDGVIPRRNKAVTMFMAKSYIGHKLCWPGDLVVNSLWAWMQGLGFSTHHGLISSAYSVYRPRLDFSHYWRFLHYLLRSAVYKWELQTRSKGVWLSRLQLSDFAFMDIPILLPPKGEAAAIVKFLDHTTRRLNRAIRAKQKVIALLNEQKQVIIHRAVTRGLNPDAPLKPSGILWLGDIPTHWATIQLARGLTKIEQGWSPVASNDEDTEDRWAVITLSAVKGGIFDPKCRKPLPKSLNPEPRFEIRQGDFLLTRANTRTLVGDVAVVGDCRRKLMLCDLIYRIGLKKEMIFPNFLMMVLLSKIGRIQIEADARGSSETMVKISHPHIRSWCIPLPPIEEQRSIFMGIESLIQPIHFAINCYNHEISLLQEFRTRLIADMVTGKLDVREAVRLIPDETEADDFPVEKVELSDGFDDLDSSGLTEKEELDEIDSNLLGYGTGANQ